MYELPPGARSINQVDFSHAIVVCKKQVMQGRLIPSGPSSPPVLGFKCKKWGNGSSNSHTTKRYHAHGAQVVGKTAVKR